MNNSEDSEDSEKVSAKDEDQPTNINKETKEIFMYLAYLFPDRFEFENDNGEYSQTHTKYNLDKNNPLLKISPNIKHSWFDPSSKDKESDTIKYWPSNTKFPSRSNPLPHKYPYKTTARTKDVTFTDPNLKKLLISPQLDSITLDHSTFDPSTVSVKDSAHPKIDVFQRAGLYDSFYSGEILDIMLSLIPIIFDEIFAYTQHEVDIPSLSLMEKLICHSIFSNDRAVHNQSAGFVINKLALRDSVLSKYQAPASTVNILRGSDFKCDNLFGPMPESFKESLNSHQGKNLTATKKGFSNFKNSKASKRPASYQRTNFNNFKRQKRSTFLHNNPFFRSKQIAAQKGYKNKKPFPKRK